MGLSMALVAMFGSVSTALAQSPAALQPSAAVVTDDAKKPPVDPCALTGEPGTLLPNSPLRIGRCSAAVTDYVDPFSLPNFQFVQPAQSPSLPMLQEFIERSGITAEPPTLTDSEADFVGPSDDSDTIIVTATRRTPDYSWIADAETARLEAEFWQPSVYSRATSFFDTSIGDTVGLIGLGFLSPYIPGTTHDALTELFLDGAADGGDDGNPGLGANRRDDRWFDEQRARMMADNPSYTRRP